MQKTAPPVFKVIIPNEKRGQTLDNFIRVDLGFSRSQIRRLKKNDGIRLNGNLVWTSTVINGGEELVLEFASKQQDFTIENIPLSIMYEDTDLVVINKSPGMVVHPVKQYQSGTIANALQYHWQQNNELASFHPVHRLDRNTSGLILIAKNSWVHQQLSLQLTNTLHRLYFAFCHGTPLKESGKIDLPIKTNPESPRRLVAADGKPALTRYRVIRATNRNCWLIVRLYTGRTHQIRVHLAHLGLPLWGDDLYGKTDLEINRPALHAVKLSFIHPRTKRRMSFTAAIPADIERLLSKIF